MQNRFIQFFLLFVILVLLQVLILDHISFLGYATPFLYIYFVFKLPIGLNRYFITFLGFLLGFTIDLFCNTPGMNAAATTFIAFFIKPIQGLFFQRNDYETYIPSISVLGGAFLRYAVLCIFIHLVLLLTIESFSYFNFYNLILKILCSTIVTSLLVFAIEGLSFNKKKL
ncbi:MAG: rod shape-determining protein MreD [Dysgonomonas sp.]